MKSNETSPAPHGVRPPNGKELRLLWKWHQKQGNVEMYGFEEATWYRRFWIAVFDDYVADCPGYAGMVINMVWGGAPDNCDMFTLEGTKLTYIGGHNDGCKSHPKNDRQDSALFHPILSMANANETPANHKFLIRATETTFLRLEVEAKDAEDAIEVAQDVPDSAWNIGDSELEIDDVVQLTKPCECGGVMTFDDFHECWDCESCHTARA